MGNDRGKNIKIIYYLYLAQDANWKEIASSQLLQLQEYGILEEADLYVHICDCFGLVTKAEAAIKQLIPSAILSFSYENKYEYPGIKLVYELAKQYPDTNFIYFHAKGISHQMQSRSVKEITLFTLTFRNWKENIRLLNTNGIQKIGLFPATLTESTAEPGNPGGWIWYNYWYATGKYLSACPDPRLTTDKYYYEGWLGLHSTDNTYMANNCKSLYKISGISKTYFSPTEADHHLNQAAKRHIEPKNKITQILSSPFLAHLYFKAKTLKRVIFSTPNN